MTTTSGITLHPAAAARRLAGGPWLMLVVLLGGQFMALLDAMRRS